MTNITSGELRVILFSLFFMAILGAFMALYYTGTTNSQIIPSNIETTTAASSSSSTSIWITDLLKPLPAPFNDPGTVFVFSIIITPITIILIPISVRYLKDLVSQWV